MAAIVVLCLLGLLSVFVFSSNTFTVFVFWVHRKKLTRTSFLVINLLVADLFYWAHRNNRGRWWVDFSRSNRLKQNNPRSQWKRSTFFSNLILVRICIFSRSDFSGTSLRLDLAASSSCNKHQGLHLQCSYRMVSWDSYGCKQFYCFPWNL